MSLDRRQLVLTAGAVALGASTSALAKGVHKPAHAAGSDGTLTRVFDQMVDTILTEGPEGATALGLDKGKKADLKYKLSDASWKGAEREDAFCRANLKTLASIPDKGLSADARLNKDVVTYALELGRDGSRFAFGNNTLSSAMGESSGPYVVSQQGGAYSGTPEFLDSQHRVDTKDDADAYLSRLAAFARVLDQETDRIKADAGKGVILPDFMLSNTIGQQEGLLKVPADKARMVSSLVTRAKAKGITGDYEARAIKIVSTEVYPALQRQLDTLKGLSAKAGHDGGVWRLPDGEAYYAWLLKVGTTTSLTPKEVHQMGLDQNAAIEARMDGLLQKQGLTKGTVGERMIALGKQPQYLFSNDDAGRAQLIAYLNGVIASVRPKLSQAFDLKLKAPVQVKRVPPDIQDGAGLGYMNTGSLDGSRPSTYYINLKSTRNWPKFSLPTLTFHETIPGHAWQGAYLTETGKLPMIRVLLSGFNAYVEGWALYSEQLGDEIGMYDTDWAGQLGYLQAQRFRAIRLVVDTGLHSDLKWSREQAIAWAVTNSGRTEQAMTSEIDRYCGTPGQACGYKVGHTEINRLRDMAKSRLGAKFNLRAFDDVVVKTGAVPLTVLGTQIDAYIASASKA